MRAPLTPASSSVTSCSTRSATASRTSFSFSSMIWSFVSSELGERDGVAASTLEPALERDLVAHAERADEHVDLPAVRVVEEEQPLARVHRVEADVRLVAEVAQQRLRVARALLRRREVEVLVLALERGGRPAERSRTATPPRSRSGTFVARAPRRGRAGLPRRCRRGSQKRPTVRPSSSMSTLTAAGFAP